MKSNKLIFGILSIIGLMLTACVEPSVEALGENDSSVVTYLPLIEITGGTTIELECDATSYTDPGAVASAGGKEIELITKVKAPILVVLKLLVQMFTVCLILLITMMEFLLLHLEMSLGRLVQVI